MKNSKRLLALAVSAALAAPMTAFATNGMNLEAYGPIAGGMGGASMAYDNGTAGMMNNPATLGLADAGNRIDVAVGVLGPDITSSMAGMPAAESDATSFVMPALGWAKKDGQLTYGLGMFAQGGMGTTYASDSFISAGTGEESMSEVGVGRLIIPLSYNVNDQFTVGGSVDYVWGGMDIRMAMDAATVGNMMMGGLVSGTMTSTLAAMPAGSWTAARFDFEKSGTMAQAVDGDGYGVKLGMTYKVNDELSIGATYHAETDMDDWSGDATMSMYNGSTSIMEMPGTMKVVDFQWPSMIGVGIDYKASDALRVVADVKQIGWEDVMANFNMEFTASNGATMNITMPQNWEDQTVVSLGVEYAASPEMLVRAGYNSSSNPIPDSTMHPMFPAIVEDHYTLGLGYAVSGHQSVDFSATIAPKVTQTNSQTNITTEHSQLNWQFMYSHKF